MRRTLAGLVVAVVALGSAMVLHAPASASGDVVALVNGSRSGMEALLARADLDAVALRHAERMAAEERLYHNPALADEVDGWKRVGENVGTGTELQSIHDAFMNSPAHRANILDAGFTEIGTGVVERNGRLWVVQVFREPVVAASAAPAPAPAPVSAPAPAPKPAVRVVAPTVAQAPAPAAAAPAPPPVAAPVEDVIAPPAVDFPGVDDVVADLTVVLAAVDGPTLESVDYTLASTPTMPTVPTALTLAAAMLLGVAIVALARHLAVQQSGPTRVGRLTYA